MIEIEFKFRIKCRLVIKAHKILFLKIHQSWLNNQIFWMHLNFLCVQYEKSKKFPSPKQSNIVLPVVEGPFLTFSCSLSIIWFFYFFFFFFWCAEITSLPKPWTRMWSWFNHKNKRQQTKPKQKANDNKNQHKMGKFDVFGNFQSTKEKKTKEKKNKRKLVTLIGLVTVDLWMVLSS